MFTVVRKAIPLAVLAAAGCASIPQRAPDDLPRNLQVVTEALLSDPSNLQVKANGIQVRTACTYSETLHNIAAVHYFDLPPHGRSNNDVLAISPQASDLDCTTAELYAGNRENPLVFFDNGVDGLSDPKISPDYVRNPAHTNQNTDAVKAYNPGISRHLYRLPKYRTETARVYAEFYAEIVEDIAKTLRDTSQKTFSKYEHSHGNSKILYGERHEHIIKGILEEMYATLDAPVQKNIKQIVVEARKPFMLFGTTPVSIDNSGPLIDETIAITDHRRIIHLYESQFVEGNKLSRKLLRAGLVHEAAHIQFESSSPHQREPFDSLYKAAKTLGTAQWFKESQYIGSNFGHPEDAATELFASAATVATLDKSHALRKKYFRSATVAQKANANAVLEYVAQHGIIEAKRP